ncbi:hypothetical protein BGZ46_002110 [Entomortierella lignicola]|nr:hypothetical protein BGZ46_002110 [Entomortierella lignicola]
MPRVKKTTLRLRSIAQKTKPLTPKPLTANLSQELQDENVIYVPVREVYEVQEFSRDREEWDVILAEPDSDGPADDDTDGEDWREIRKPLRLDEDWSELIKKMQSAAAAVKATKPHDGTTRQNLHRRKMILKKAAAGTSPLSTFGFTAPTPPSSIMQGTDSISQRSFEEAECAIMKG